MEINLVNDLEEISLKSPNKILKIKVYFLEILIHKGFISSTKF